MLKVARMSERVRIFWATESEVNSNRPRKSYSSNFSNTEKGPMRSIETWCLQMCECENRQLIEKMPSVGNDAGMMLITCRQACLQRKSILCITSVTAIHH
jgi:hypothetical protein